MDRMDRFDRFDRMDRMDRGQDGQETHFTKSLDGLIHFKQNHFKRFIMANSLKGHVLNFWFSEDRTKHKRRNFTSFQRTEPSTKRRNFTSFQRIEPRTCLCICIYAYMITSIANLDKWRFLY